MSASLVGSEMCIRDRWNSLAWLGLMRDGVEWSNMAQGGGVRSRVERCDVCLLYTSDAADDM
eukprot:7594171-Alexandrium_andersonii.AAC.1